MFPILFMEYSGKNILEFIHFSTSTIGLLRKKSVDWFFGQHPELLNFDANLTGDIAFWYGLKNSNSFWRGKKMVLRRMDTENRI